MFFSKNKPKTLEDIQLPLEIHAKFAFAFNLFALLSFSIQAFFDPSILEAFLKTPARDIFIVWFIFVFGMYLFSLLSWSQTFRLTQQELSVRLLGRESSYRLKDIESITLGEHRLFIKKQVISVVVRFQCGKKIKLHFMQKNYQQALFYLTHTVPVDKQKRTSAYWHQFVF